MAAYWGKNIRTTETRGYVQNSCKVGEAVLVLNRVWSPLNKMKFRQSCFGQYLDMPEQKYQGQMICALLLRMVDAREAGILKFVFPKRSTELGRREFFIITGLPFKGCVRLPDNSCFYNRYFAQYPYLKLCSVKKEFIQKARQDPDSEDAYRLGLCYFLYAAFFNNEGRSKGVLDSRYAHALDDVAGVAGYAWGELAYAYFISRMYEIYERVKVSAADGWLPVTDLYGFTNVLQCYVWESLKNLPRTWATMTPGLESVLPRIFRWTADKSPPYKEMEGYFSDGSDARFAPIWPSDLEKSFLKGQGLPCWVEFLSDTDSDEGSSTRIKRLRRRLMFDESSNEASLAATHGSTTIGSSFGTASHAYTQSPVTHLPPPVSVQQQPGRPVQSLTTLVREAIAEMSRMVGDHQLQVAEILRNEECQAKNKVFLTDFYRNLPLTKKNIHVGTNGSSSNVWSNVIVVEKETPAYIDKGKYGDVCAAKEKGKRKVVDGVAERIPKCERPKLGLVVPRAEKTLQESHWDQFYRWYHSSASTASTLFLRTSLKDFNVLTPARVANLVEREAWLTNEELDLAFSTVLKKAATTPQLFKKRWAYIDADGWFKMNDKNLNYADARIGEYARGLLPLERPISWAGVDHIYGIAYPLELHWVAYDVDIDNQKITVYDSMMNCQGGWSKIQTGMKVASEFLPWFFAKHNLFAQRGATVLPSRWQLELYRRTTQQQMPCDSGLMAMKNVECLISGIPVENVNASLCGLYKREYCTAIWNFKMDDLH